MKAHKSTILSVIYRFVDNPDDAEDIFQDVMVRAWKGWSNYRGYYGSKPALPERWMYAIAVNTCINWLKRNNSATRSLHIATCNGSNITSTTEQIAMDFESVDSLASYIASLSEDFRITMTLRALYGLSLQQIADTLGIPIGTVKSRLHAAKVQLEAMIQQENSHE